MIGRFWRAPKRVLSISTPMHCQIRCPMLSVTLTGVATGAADASNTPLQLKLSHHLRSSHNRQFLAGAKGCCHLQYLPIAPADPLADTCRQRSTCRATISAIVAAGAYANQSRLCPLSHRPLSVSTSSLGKYGGFVRRNFDILHDYSSALVLTSNANRRDRIAPWTSRSLKPK